jgi:hypothetical protein
LQEGKNQKRSRKRSKQKINEKHEPFSVTNAALLVYPDPKNACESAKAASSGLTGMAAATADSAQNHVD